MTVPITSRKKGHGTRASYNRGCRCQPCRVAKSRYAKRRELLIASGRPHTDSVAVEAVRPLLLRWRARGVGIPQIAAEAGVGLNTVRRIVLGQGSYVTADVAAKLRAANPRPAGGAYVDATGTRRRLQALSRIGWTYRQLGDRGGWHKNSVGGLIRRQTQVEQQIADRVAVLYRQLHLTWPVGASAVRARQRAKARGWVSPLAWDTDTIDDPAAVPDTGRTAQRAKARQKPAQREREAS